jgi:signal recognition particle subunit SRP54
MFDVLTDSFTTAVNKVRFYDDIGSLQKALKELKKSLLKADVHHKIVKDLLANVEASTKEAGIGKENFLKALQDHLTVLLTTEGSQGFIFAPKPPTTIMMMGLQGSGKTTTTGKLATYIKSKNKKVLLAAADLQRLAAVEQLRQIAADIDVDIFFDESVTDPVKVARLARQKAIDEHYDVLLIDTAGRLAIDEELMDELSRMKETIAPDEIFYVADSLTGQDSVRTAQTFNEKIGIDGVILSKYDGDSKGGVALGIASQVQVPLRFIGNGERMADLEVFIPERIVNRLMGAGDVNSLAERTAAVMDEKKAKQMTSKIKKGKFNFNDFLDQIEMVKKMGSLKSIMSMIPGMGGMSKALGDMDLENSDEMKRIKAMISSMTKKEREDPDLLNNSRKQRIATGAGLEIVEVNKVLKQFKNASKMAKKLAGKGGKKQMENMMAQMQGGGMPGGLNLPK